MCPNTAHACRGVISNTYPVDDCLVENGTGHDAVDESCAGEVRIPERRAREVTPIYGRSSHDSAIAISTTQIRFKNLSLRSLPR